MQTIFCQLQRMSYPLASQLNLSYFHICQNHVELSLNIPNLVELPDLQNSVKLHENNQNISLTYIIIPSNAIHQNPVE